MGYQIIERNITPNELFIADEAFFSGTAAEIAPISKVNNRVIGTGKTGPVTKKILEEFDKIINDPKEGIAIY